MQPRGILRQDYIRNEIETKYGEYGYGDLRSDVSEKTSGALKQLLMALLSDKLDFERAGAREGDEGLRHGRGLFDHHPVHVGGGRDRASADRVREDRYDGACSRRWSPRRPTNSANAS